MKPKPVKTKDRYNFTINMTVMERFRAYSKITLKPMSAIIEKLVTAFLDKEEK